MSSIPQPRRKLKISDSLNRQLNTYALAASAAGVSVLASVQPAQAKIVYKPTHKVLPYGITYIDLNHDGINDLAINRFQTSRSNGAGTLLDVVSGSFVATHVGVGDVEDLKAGYRIRAHDVFADYGAMGEALWYHHEGQGSFTGPWMNGGKGVKNRYIGAKFRIGGKVHYGWIRLSVCFPHKTVKAVMTGYAYETIPGKGIVAGKTKGPDVATASTATLGHLATGASAIPAWRSGR